MKDFPTIKKLKPKGGIAGTTNLESTGLGEGFSAKSVAEIEEELRPKNADDLADIADKVTKGDNSSKAAEVRARAALVRAKSKKLKELEGMTAEDLEGMEAELPKIKKKK
jgi:hypothetical protein